MRLNSIFVWLFLLIFQNSTSNELPPFWSRHISPQGVPYYYNSRTRQTTWDKPIAQTQFSAQAEQHQPQVQQQQPTRPHQATHYQRSTTTTLPTRHQSAKVYGAGMTHATASYDEREQMLAEIQLLRSRLNETLQSRQDFREKSITNERVMKRLNDEVVSKNTMCLCHSLYFIIVSTIRYCITFIIAD